MTDTDLSDWLPIAEAARIIGCSTRTVERLARAKKLEQRLRPQAGTPGVAVFSPESVREEAQRRRPASAPFVVAAVGTSNSNGHRHTTGLTKGSIAQHPGDDPIRQLAAAFQRFLLSPPLPPVAERVAETTFVTIAEASAITGLTQAYLRRAIGNLTLPAIRDRGWRIRRKDLEAL